MKTKQQKTMTAGQVELMCEKFANQFWKNDGALFVKLELADNEEADNLFDMIKRSERGYYHRATTAGRFVVISFGVEMDDTPLISYFKIRSIVENYKVKSIKLF
jgi:hypothetical protein